MTLIAEVMATLLPQLLVAAPLGFAGLLMFLDPGMFTGIVDDVVAAIRRFEMALRGDCRAGLRKRRPTPITQQRLFASPDAY